MFEDFGFHTASGRRLIITDPDPDGIELSDIAISLARKCRFGGHMAKHVPHYSVAQHSVLVAANSGGHAKFGLLHDAEEAFLGDFIRPFRRAMGKQARREVESIEYLWRVAIGWKFDIDLRNMPHEVKVADDRALATEARDMYWGISYETPGLLPYEETIIPLDVSEAYCLFMQSANALGLR